MHTFFDKSNLRNISKFFNLDKTFFITYGEKGIGKSTFLLSQIKDLADKDARIIYVDSRNYQNSYPLSAICLALNKPLITPYAVLLNELCETSNVVFYIENPHMLLPDDKIILSEAIRFILHSEIKNPRIILDFDSTKRLECFLDPLITSRNTYLATFHKMDPEKFGEYLNSLIVASSSTINLILSYSEQNFSKLDDFLLMLIENGVAHYDNEGNIICDEVDEFNLENSRIKNITKQYEHIADELKLVLRYSALMGPTVLSALLQDPLNVLTPEKSLCEIEAATGWIKKDDTLDFWKWIFQDSIIYCFSDEHVLKNIRNLSSSNEKDNIYSKLAKYLEIKYRSFPSKDTLLHMEGIILATIGYYYERYDRKKSIEFNRQAGDCFSRNKLFYAAATHYEYCFNNAHDEKSEIEYFCLLLQSLISAELVQNAQSLIKEKYISTPRLMRNPQIRLLYAEVLYELGYPNDCLELLIMLEKELLNSQNDYFAFQVHSLLASTYDWLNNVKERKLHFQKTISLLEHLPSEKRDIAFCRIYKRANMVYDFNIPNVQLMMKKSCDEYRKLGLYKDSYECAHNIGLSYIFLCDFKEANNYISLAMNGFTELKSRDIYVSLNSMGILHMLKGEYEDALYYLSRIDTEVIEPFCAYSTQINKLLCEIRIQKKASPKLSIPSSLEDLEKTNGIDMELRLPYVNLQIAQAFLLEQMGNQRVANTLFQKAISLCDEKNSNFYLQGVICAKMLCAGNRNNLPKISKAYLAANSELADICIAYKLTICDYLFWK